MLTEIEMILIGSTIIKKRGLFLALFFELFDYHITFQTADAVNV